MEEAQKALETRFGSLLPRVWTAIILLVFNFYFLAIVHSEGPPFAWIKQAGGTNYDEGFRIAADSTSHVYVIGNFHGTATFGDTNVNNGPGFIAKYDNLGNLLWANSYPSDFRGVGLDASDNLYLAGSFTGTTYFGTTTLTNNPGGHSIWIAKFDASGTVIWAKQSAGSGFAIGGFIAVDTSGNSYVTGHFDGNVNFGNITLTSTNTGTDIFTVKYDSSGNVVWANQSRSIDLGNNAGASVAVDATTNSYIAGYFQSATITFGSFTLTNSGGYDIFVVMYDDAGNVVWAKRAGGSGTDFCFDIAADNSGNSYITGSFSGVATFGGITLTNGPFFIAKYESAGNVVWAKQATNSAGLGIAVDVSGNSYVAGRFSSTATFGSTTLTNNGAAGTVDILVAKFDGAGNVLWAKQAGGNSDDDANGITLDVAGNSYVTGFFGGTATIGNTNLVSNGGWDIFVAKIDADPPRLTIALAGSQLILSWVTNQPGFALETVTSLSPSNLWSAVTNSVAIVGNQNTVTNEISNVSQFFRLHKP